MSNIARDLRVWLVGKTEVNSLVGTRIYPNDLPQKAELPACTYQVISSIPAGDLATGDVDVAVTRIQIDCYSDMSPVEAEAIASAIRKTAGLQGYRGDMNGTWVKSVVCDDAYSLEDDAPTDGSDKRRYFVSQDYRIVHEDT